MSSPIVTQRRAAFNRPHQDCGLSTRLEPDVRAGVNDHVPAASLMGVGNNMCRNTKDVCELRVPDRHGRSLAAELNLPTYVLDGRDSPVRVSGEPLHGVAPG